MRRDWIIDVLADLRAFAEHNGLDATAAGLEDASLVALAEISSIERPRAENVAVAVPVQYGDTDNVTNIFAHR